MPCKEVRFVRHGHVGFGVVLFMLSTKISKSILNAVSVLDGIISDGGYELPGRRICYLVTGSKRPVPIWFHVGLLESGNLLSGHVLCMHGWVILLIRVALEEDVLDRLGCILTDMLTTRSR